ncbi:hypothetical protein KOR34_52440 [Posidoniimonas corsicana]|uniref:Uncharacterized protein n=1 Tax=Posidoniimonas corsicana TaxID=1938618 RepID=A0A5C5USI0_9BACT|nr:hypothetical protein [Posidoniimonas corsicana]TWT29334.1 hypothetical protein KOR34_52440 [Posidoniimonas corsicana]
MAASLADNLTVAKPIAAEDLRAGEYVAVLNEVVEYASFLWCCDSSLLQPDEPVRVTFRPQSPAAPLRIKAVCLPFVAVKTACGKTATLDVRSCQLVRLDNRFAREAKRAYGAKPKSGKKSRRRRRK